MTTTTTTTTTTTLPTSAPDVRRRILDHLARLVACDTRNPPRAGQGIDTLFAIVREALPASFVIEERDLGDGCRWLRAVRGHRDGADGAEVPFVPIVNVHIDTVPRDDGWQGDPFTLTTAIVDGVERAVGLGACDIKGAVAAFLVAAVDTEGSGAPAELVLTSDEEAGSSRCVRTFVVEHPVAGRLILVAEPTSARAVVAHRGIGTATVTFNGIGGHASLQRATHDSAVAEAVRFCARALDVAAADDNTIRLNLGRIEGGTKANMIASSCLLRFGVRPPPEQTPESVLDQLSSLVSSSRGQLERGFLAPALPAPFGERSVAQARANSRARAEAIGLTVGDDVDFFTEAAFFSAAGADAVVFGPGDIAQAHTADEWVTVSDLVAVAAAYTDILLRSAQ